MRANVIASRWSEEKVTRVQFLKVRDASGTGSVQALSKLTHPIVLHFMHIENFLLELGHRLAKSGYHSVVAVTDDQNGQWGAFSFENGNVTGGVSDWGENGGCLLSIFRTTELAPAIFQNESFTPDKSAERLACEILSKFLSIQIKSMDDWFDLCVDHYCNEIEHGFSDWKNRLVLPPLCIVNEGKLLVKPREVPIDEAKEWFW